MVGPSVTYSAALRAETPGICVVLFFQKTQNILWILNHLNLPGISDELVAKIISNTTSGSIEHFYF